MNIFVDTSFKLGFKLLYKQYSALVQKSVVDSFRTYFAYPIFFKNLTDTILYLGMGNYLENLNKQALNKKGVWVDIEKPLEFQCGTCLRDLYLDVGETLVAKLIRYKGKSKTLCRLKYHVNNQTIYSNTFWEELDFK